VGVATGPNPATLLERIRHDVERNRVRARNGLRHLAGIGHVEVGCSPKEVVWRRDKVQLYRYRSDRRTLAPPILLVMSLVTKPYVFDLRPGNSFVEALVARGFDVYMVDWGVPDAAESDNTLETYCDEYLPFACAAAMRASGADEIHVFGYCFGGVLSLIFAAGHPEMPVRSLSLMATPVDFREMGAASALVRDERLRLDDLVDETGNVPADAVFWAVSSARVTGDATAFASLLENLESSEYIAAHQAMHGWATDHIPFPGACFRQTAQWLFRENRLAENRLETARGPIDVASLGMPVMNSVGTFDHIVPLAANTPLRDLIPHADHLEFETGHVGLIIGSRAHRVSVPGMIEWIAGHSDEPAP
jgi:polyhydroxyalkanoate synthase subunit PhaC